MADQTAAVLAASDQTDPVEQTGPRAMDDAEWIAKVRDEIPDWQTKGRTELIDAVQTIAGCGRSRAIRLRNLAFPELAADQPARKPTPVRRPRPPQTDRRSQTAPASMTDQSERTEPAPLTPAEVDRIIAEFHGLPQTESLMPASDSPEFDAEFDAPTLVLSDQTPAPVHPRQPGKVWAYVGALLGGLGSVAANIAHSFVPPAGASLGWQPEAGSVIAAAFWPLAVLIVVEILARVVWPEGRQWKALKFCGLVPVAIVAAVVSYRHLSGLLGHYGEDSLTVVIGPLAVDGLMVLATGALIALGRMRRANES